MSPDQTTLILELIRQHTEEDARRFAAVDKKLDEIAADVKALLQARHEGKGAWKATVAIAGSVSTLVGLAVAWFV